ncbi:MAG: EAL domain-containing protein [Campylobacterota bacterium]|nr:EAL domain-containing protein [Campylobacterota bacterium]
MIKELINNNQIEIFLQPIVSIRNKRIYSFEALTRAKDKNNDYISPVELFEEARKENLSSFLDCYVRSLALKKFKKYYDEDDKLLLFLNFESSIIDNDISDDFIEKVKRSGISASNIVIEIKEDSINHSLQLEKFVNKYKKEGFIIAVDDFGTGYSSFDRLSLIKPHLVKIDRSLIFDIHNNFVNSQILNGIANMCHKIGALVLAEGVESKSEILHCMKIDIDIFQGFYFSKPLNQIDTENKDSIIDTVQNMGVSYKNILQNHINKKIALLERSKELAKSIVHILDNDIDDISVMLFKVVKNDNKIEAIYLLNKNSGVQIGETIIEQNGKLLYTPTNCGHDHSLKEYYFLAKESIRGDYLSGEYISKASGNMCRTYSYNTSLKDNKYIVCFDIIV